MGWADLPLSNGTRAKVCLSPLTGPALSAGAFRVQRPFLGALAAAVAAGALFHRLGVPVARLLGPLFAGAALAIARGSAAAWMSPGWIRASQGWIGMSVGAAFSFDGFLAAADFLPVMFAAVAGTLLLSLAGGWLIWRLTGLDRRTSLLGSTPGAASTMVILSGELGGRRPHVALLQFMRHVAMLAAAPVLISQAFSSVGGSMLAQMEPPPQEAALMGFDVGAAADVHWTAVPIWARYAPGPEPRSAGVSDCRPTASSGRCWRPWRWRACFPGRKRRGRS